ncbi:MAG: hypothetical protein KatS3mg009_2911 [Acidimicrobiia bacterium]|nr:MAG: hypothetical protein KatS3mg009_2911 [Acidimicrobiia bacterium]
MVETETAEPGASNGAPDDATLDPPTAGPTPPRPDSAVTGDGGASASRDDATAAIGSVVDLVRERGFITTGEIFAAFPDLEPDTDVLRDLYETFEGRGIKVLDEIAEELHLEDQRRTGVAPDPAAGRRRGDGREHRPAVVSRPGGAPARGAPDDADDALGRAAARVAYSEGGSFDPVRMYLKEIGKVPLLTAQQEVDLARRIEAGLHAAQQLDAAGDSLTEVQRTSLLANVRRRRARPPAAHRGQPPAWWSRSRSATSGAGWRCWT